MTKSLRELLAEKILIFDGAVGTEIYKRNFFLNLSYENLCLTSPEIVREIHESYRRAGAEVLTTNSFGANQLQLNKFLLADRVAEINQRAVELAREVAKDDLLVAASVGPLGDLPVNQKIDPVAVLREQVQALIGAQPDFLLFETLSGGRDLSRVLEVMQQFPDFPYVVSFACDRNAVTKSGDSFARMLTLIEPVEPKPQALGLNCGSGPGAMLHALKIVLEQAPLPVIVQPNAGVPRGVDNRIFYMCNPEYFSTYAQRFVALGARGVGGCCGTGPEHIRDMAQRIKPLSHTESATHAIFVEEKALPEQPALPLAERSNLGAKLARREWVQTVEIVPPEGYNLEPVIAKARACRAAGFDAVNLPDGPRASSRVSSIAAACRIQQEAGIEAVLHFCCRDRNLIGIQSGLLGCAALNICNLLFITGDPPKLGNYPQATGVFDIDSIGTVKLQSRLNRSIDLVGKPFTPGTHAVIGVGADPNALDMAREIRRTREKIAAGADFLVTQPVFDIVPLLRFIEAIPELEKIPVIAGIWPLASFRNAEFMRNEVPGVSVPDDIMARMAQGKDKDAQRTEGIKIAREAIAAIRSHICGVQVSAPFGNVQTAQRVIAPEAEI